MTLHDSPARPADAAQDRNDAHADGRVTVRYWAGARAAAGTDIDLLLRWFRSLTCARRRWPGIPASLRWPHCARCSSTGSRSPDRAAVGSGSWSIPSPFAGG